MIYTDGIHLVTDGEVAELHEFASRLGLRRGWFQDHRHPHYDLTGPRLLARALALGARAVTSRELVRVVKIHG